MPSFIKSVIFSSFVFRAFAQTTGTNQSCRPNGDSSCNFICGQPGDKDFCSPVDQSNALISCQPCAKATSETCPLADFFTPLCAYTCTTVGTLGKCYPSIQTGPNVIGCTKCPGAPTPDEVNQTCRPNGDPKCNFICAKPGVKDYCSPVDQSNALIGCQPCTKATSEECPPAELYTPLCIYSCTVVGHLGKCYTVEPTGKDVIGCNKCPRGVSSGTGTGTGTSTSPATYPTGSNTTAPPPAYTGGASAIRVSGAAVMGLFAIMAFF
ncbi:hypothetical protein ABW20_dc0105528 [Dactylellina cionopaga]|nr:hypothetical protein ABW20_dc0105528 [Dactylellina cionopaga]